MDSRACARYQEWGCLIRYNVGFYEASGVVLRYPRGSTTAVFWTNQLFTSPGDWAMIATSSMLRLLAPPLADQVYSLIIISQSSYPVRLHHLRDSGVLSFVGDSSLSLVPFE